MTTHMYNQELKQTGLIVMCSGVATSIFALYAAFAIPEHLNGPNVMGIYANFLIPIGALAIGFLAGSGYAIAAWILGTRFSKRAMLGILVAQIVTYFGAKYSEYISINPFFIDGGKIGFWRYYDLVVQNLIWQRNEFSEGIPLGIFGYLANTLEIAGFSAGGILIPFLLTKKAYCQNCQVYMKDTKIATITAGISTKKIKDKNADVLDNERENVEIFKRGMSTLEQMIGFVNAGQTQKFLEMTDLANKESKNNLKPLAQVNVRKYWCPQCQSGYILPILQTGSGDNATVEKLQATNFNEAFFKGY